MSALFYKSALVDNGDFVGILDGGKAVGNDDGRSAAAQLVKRLLYKYLGGVVEGACRLIKDEYGGVFKENSCYAYALFLPARELDAALAYIGIIAVRQRHDIIMDIGALGGLYHLRLGGVKPAVKDIVAYGAAE